MQGSHHRLSVLAVATLPVLTNADTPRGVVDATNYTPWSPWSGIFSRPASEIFMHVGYPLPSMLGFLSRHQPTTLLEIGCGVGRTLLAMQVHMANARRRSGNSTAGLCATGMSFLNYTHFIYEAIGAKKPTLHVP